MREVIALYLAFRIASGLEFADFIEGILITGLALAVATYLVKPIINILILPLSLATLGLFRFVAHAIMLFIVDLALPQFSVSGFHFVGAATQFGNIPPINFGAGPLAYIGFSVVIATLSTTLHWIAK